MSESDTVRKREGRFACPCVTDISFFGGAMREINARQRAFAEAYARSHRAEEAALEAGYGAKGARSRASELLKDPTIQELIRRRQKELADELYIDESRLIREAWETFEQCKEGTPHLSWNSETRQKEPDGTWVFDSRGAVAALKLVAELSGCTQSEKSEDGKTEVNIISFPETKREAMG